MDSGYFTVISVYIAIWVVGVTLLVAALIWPPWFYAKKYHGASIWSLFILVPSLIVWFALIFAGIGPDDWAAFVGILYLAAATVFFYYLKAFILDKVHHQYKHSTYVVVALSCVFAVVLSLIMPPIH